ncbi:MAG: hypothetical protein NC916_01915 [Candidatus Omnitrophica bacterium]|nr:hypothetical protein [Candidatus Omnitrophota bacterium]
MINIDFSLAIGLYTLFFLAILLTPWVFSKKEKGRNLTLDPKFIWFCSVCTYTYINTREENISVCPRCASYNKR